MITRIVRPGGTYRLRALEKAKRANESHYTTSTNENEVNVARYGLPYQGSKSRIAKWIVDVLPPSQVFVDLFAGGCAVTHCALLSGKWERFVCNDITDSAVFFNECAHGRFEPSVPMPTREEFFALKDTDPYIRLCGSFGNDQKSYLYGRHIEAVKVTAGKMIYEQDRNKRYQLYKQFVRELGSYLNSTEFSRRALKSEMTERLQALEGLQALAGLQALERLQALAGDYKGVDITDNATVYCDIPYKGVKQYGTAKFNHDEFYEWALTRNFPVFVSEYEMPDEFSCIASIPLNTTMCATANGLKRTERVFVQKRYELAYTLGI